jgi:uncharacterized protein
MISPEFIESIARELRVRPEQVAAVLPLLDKGAGIPFIAHYRKDACGNLREDVIERIALRNMEYTALENRRAALLQNLAAQGILSEELNAAVAACRDKATLDDLALAYKKPKRTRGAAAREAGLQPLADFLLAQEAEKPVEAVAAEHAKPHTPYGTPEAALQGARDILAETFAVMPALRGRLRQALAEKGVVHIRLTKPAPEAKVDPRYREFEDLKVPVSEIAPGKLLSALRGARFGQLRIDIELDETAFWAEVSAIVLKPEIAPSSQHVRMALEDAFRRLLRPEIEQEVIHELRTRAEDVLIHGFRLDCEQHLMAPAYGARPAAGMVAISASRLCAVAVASDGAFLASCQLEPAAPEAVSELAAFLNTHGLDCVGIANAPVSREMSRFVAEAIAKSGRSEAVYCLVNDVGLSIHASSKAARDEMPEADASTRAALCIARRLQDPMRELLKLEPRDIAGVSNQYDINQRRLREALCRTIESCVSRVGADVNTAPVDVLRYVCGLQMGAAQNIIAFRAEQGGIKSRQQLLQITGIGEKTFEQCAGFLFVVGGEHALDATRIHPEAYGIVAQIAEKAGLTPEGLLQHPFKFDAVDLAPFHGGNIGKHALDDIRYELRHPRRDPRLPFRIPRRDAAAQDLAALQEGAVVDGVIVSVTEFGAFVDIGVHHLALLHRTEISQRRYLDPRTSLRIGEVVQLKVLKIDREKQRVSLSRRALEAAVAPRPQRPVRAEQPRREEVRREAGDGTASPESAAPDRAARAQRFSERRDEGRAARRREDEAPRRPRRDEARPARERTEAGQEERRPARKAGGASKVMASRHGTPSAVKHADSDSQFNTSLAEQLEAMRKKLA